MARSLSLLLAIAGLGVGAGSEKASAEAPVSACSIELHAAVPVRASAQDLLFEAADGTLFLPSDLRVPAKTRVSQDIAPGPDLPAGATILAVPIGPPDRWGRVPAWIVLQSADDLQLWQARQLEQGSAFFAPLHAEAGCADALRRVEGRARREGAGFWRQGGAGFAYRTDRPDLLDASIGRYVIARGRVVSLGKTRSTRYLNFGRYWKTDVTGTLRVSDEDAFNATLARTGWHLDALAGRFVELRGVVEKRDGPHFTLRNPEQLVVLEDKRAGRDGQGNN